jgi:hypothetical protein
VSKETLGRRNNDFSIWIRTAMGNEELAAKISRLDPYTYTMEDLRERLIRLIEKSIRT